MSKRGYKAEDFPEKYRKQIDRQIRASVPASYLEPATSKRKMGKNENTAYAAPCRLVVYCRRRRWCDTDNISLKACVDGLVHGGILEDDRFIEDVHITQAKCEKGEEEKTTIELWRI